MKLLLYEPTFLFSISQSDLNIQKHTSRQYMPRKMQPINYRDCNRGASGWLALGPDPLCSLGQVRYSPFRSPPKYSHVTYWPPRYHTACANCIFPLLRAGSWACPSPSTRESSGQSVQKQTGRSPSLTGRCLRGNLGEDFTNQASTAAVGITSRLNIITSFRA